MKTSETVQSFNTLNYSGMLYNKAKAETPLLNAIGGRVAKTNSVEFPIGQDYSSEEASIPEISENASLTAPDATYVTRAQKTNVTQIFMKTVAISYAKMSNMGTLSGVNIAGQEANPYSELDFQVGCKMDTLKKDIEKTFIQGTYNKATTDAQVNKTRGLNTAITTNTVAAGTKDLTIWMVNELVQKIDDAGGDIEDLTLFVSPVQLNQITANALKYGVKMGEAYYSTFGIQIRELLLPTATVKITLGKYLPSGVALLLNLNAIRPVEQDTPGKGNFFLEQLSKTGAGEKWQIFGQIGLDHGFEYLHGKITGLTTTFTVPDGSVDVNVVNTTTAPVNTKEVAA